ncbi:hypothetical protein HN011_007996 [Eciton burchellii]|nr:hypothetical protein HN011_007996 [Eciton burchellii]
MLRVGGALNRGTGAVEARPSFHDTDATDECAQVQERTESFSTTVRIIPPLRNAQITTRTTTTRRDTCLRASCEGNINAYTSGLTVRSAVKQNEQLVICRSGYGI